ncbi:uncharacterized protein LOC101238262 [Hydra vulgaris]|uniref:uncharacterized protein LOC101238262 n=1 Tax=Hydra vulgaris TaxID=6087 RepID=UPI001F5E63EB|nr:MFS-type transporter clz9-like [Hydra vulgaris]
MSLRKAENSFGVSRKTLKRQLQGKVRQIVSNKLGNHVNTFSIEIEQDLVKHIQMMERALFELTTTDIRRLAFDMAERLHLKHSFNNSSRQAGKDWLSGFLKRHPELTIRVPEATSMNRAVGFNRPKVDQFFTVYEDILTKNAYEPQSIWNMDETGITNVQKPGKVLATKDVRQVGKITSAERGTTVTVICAMNASGSYIPPMLIFPRKRLIDQLMKGAPPGSIGGASASGWTDSTLFLKWLEHFALHTSASISNLKLLIVDGHHSHKTLEAIDFCRDHGIAMITLPPHCTHKMQPLDQTFFKPLKCSYNSAADNWMRTHPGKRITLYDMAEIFVTAYATVAAVDKAVKGFEVSGIFPFNKAIFTDEYFIAAQLTDEPEPVITLAILDDSARNETSEPTNTNEEAGDSNESNENQLDKIADHPGLSKALQIISELSPIPRIKNVRSRKRKTEAATVITSSPYKAMLIEANAKKTKQNKQVVVENNNEENDEDKIDVIADKSKRTKSGDDKETGKRKQYARTKSKRTIKSNASNANVIRKGSKERRCVGSVTNSDDTPCCMCGKRFNEPPIDDWQQCPECLNWYHDGCGPDDTAVCFHCQ